MSKGFWINEHFITYFQYTIVITFCLKLFSESDLKCHKAEIIDQLVAGCMGFY